MKMSHGDDLTLASSIGVFLLRGFCSRSRKPTSASDRTMRWQTATTLECPELPHNAALPGGSGQNCETAMPSFPCEKKRRASFARRAVPWPFANSQSDHGVAVALGEADALAEAEALGDAAGMGAVAPTNSIRTALLVLTVPAIEPVPVKPLVDGSKSKPPPMICSPVGTVALHSAPFTSSVVVVLSLELVSARLPMNGIQLSSGVSSPLSSVNTPVTWPRPNPPVATPSLKVTQVQSGEVPGQVAA